MTRKLSISRIDIKDIKDKTSRTCTADIKRHQRQETSRTCTEDIKDIHCGAEHQDIKDRTSRTCNAPRSSGKEDSPNLKPFCREPCG
jgi:hypothetical protein